MMQNSLNDSQSHTIPWSHGRHRRHRNQSQKNIIIVCATFGSADADVKRKIKEQKGEINVRRFDRTAWHSFVLAFDGWMCDPASDRCATTEISFACIGVTSATASAQRLPIIIVKLKSRRIRNPTMRQRKMKCPNNFIELHLFPFFSFLCEFSA